MKQMLFMFMACLTLAGCGLGETAVSAAAGASSQAEQAKEALRTEERVKQQLDQRQRSQHSSDRLLRLARSSIQSQGGNARMDWDSTARSEALLGVRSASCTASSQFGLLD